MTTVIQKTFQRERVLLPVIHVADLATARRSIDTAFEAGADGVMLITQGADAPTLRVLADHAFDGGEERFVGVNYLGFNLPTANRSDYTTPKGRVVQGVWADDSGLTDPRQTAKIQANVDGLVNAFFPMNMLAVFFGGVAFKTQPRVGTDEELAKLTRVAKFYCDVVTTSGPQTGTPPSTEKIQRMAEALQSASGHPFTPGGSPVLGIASGITPDNVTPFLPYAHAYLVATGIERRWGELDPAKTRALAEAIHA